MDILQRVETDMSGHRGHEGVRAFARGLDTDALALQVTDAADFVFCEQFVAANMHPAQHRERSALIDGLDDPRREIQGEIRLAASDLLREFNGRPVVDVANLGKAFGAQQLLGEVLRSNADAGKL